MPTHARRRLPVVRIAAALLVGALTAMALAAHLANRTYWLNPVGYWTSLAPAGVWANDPAGNPVPIAGVELALFRDFGLEVAQLHVWPASERAELEKRQAQFAERAAARAANPETPADRVNPQPNAFTRSRAAPWTDSAPWRLDDIGPSRNSTLVNAGWPWPIAWCCTPSFRPSEPREGFGHGAYITRRKGWVMLPSAAIHDKSIPLTPIWVNLLAAAPLYALPWFALLSLPRILLAARAALRRRRNRCSRCGYSRAGLAPAAPCPECGTAA